MGMISRPFVPSCSLLRYQCVSCCYFSFPISPSIDSYTAHYLCIQCTIVSCFTVSDISRETPFGPMNVSMTLVFGLHDILIALLFTVHPTRPPQIRVIPPRVITDPPPRRFLVSLYNHDQPPLSSSPMYIHPSQCSVFLLILVPLFCNRMYVWEGHIHSLDGIVLLSFLCLSFLGSTGFFTSSPPLLVHTAAVCHCRRSRACILPTSCILSLLRCTLRDMDLN